MGRVAHPFHAEVAVRLIVWFPPGDPGTVVVALFAGDKARMGDVFYEQCRCQGRCGDRSVVVSAAEGEVMSEQFVRGNDRVDRMLADPDTRRRVDQIRSEMDQADREQKMDLAAFRQAADLTQVELAQRMGIKQSAVSGLEARDDMLLSTLANYLSAAGASNPRVVVTVGGHDVEYPLPTPRD